MTGLTLVVVVFTIHYLTFTTLGKRINSLERERRGGERKGKREKRRGREKGKRERGGGGKRGRDIEEVEGKRRTKRMNRVSCIYIMHQCMMCGCVTSTCRCVPSGCVINGYVISRCVTSGCGPISPDPLLTWQPP